jgi:Ni/Co efflux regulator RcnB
MKTMTAAIAGLLLAGASSQALAQDRDHGDRGDRGQDRPAQAAAPAQQAAPPAARPPQAGPRAPQDGHARFGAPPAPGQVQGGPAAGAQVAPGQPPQGRGGPGRDGAGRDGQGREGQRFQGGQPGAPAPVFPNGQPRFDRGPGDARQPDRQRGPREVIPGGPERGPDRGNDRGFDGRRDGRDGRDGRWNGDRADGRDHRDGDRHDNPWRRGDRWQPGRAPPVFWSQDRYRIGGYRAPYGYYVRTWGFGDFLPRGWYAQDYWIGDFLDYDLPYPPPGYTWVRVGGDALMIDRFTGRIVQVVRGIFW